MVLFDEIEKAHPDVFNVLLQILDEGRLTDSQGRTVDFRNTVLIMTSNLGSQDILEMGTANWGQVEAKVLELLRRSFKPEFLNRVDDTIIFRPLSEADIAKIVEVQLTRFERLLDERKLTLDVTPAAKQLLVSEGCDPIYGARPLKRSMQQLLQNPLKAMAVLEGAYVEGDTIRADRGKDGHVELRESAEQGERGEGSGRSPGMTSTDADRRGMNHAIDWARLARSVDESARWVRPSCRTASWWRKHRNETIGLKDPTAHAELLTIHRRALRALDTDRLTDCTLYITLEPCAQLRGAVDARESRAGGVRGV